MTASSVINVLFVFIYLVYGVVVFLSRVNFEGENNPTRIWGLYFEVCLVTWGNFKFEVKIVLLRVINGVNIRVYFQCLKLKFLFYFRYVLFVCECFCDLTFKFKIKKSKSDSS